MFLRNLRTLNFDKSYRYETKFNHQVQPRLLRRMNAGHVVSDVNNGWSLVDMSLGMSLVILKTLRM